MAQALVQLISDKFKDDVIRTHAQHGDETVVVKPGAWLPIHRFLFEDPSAKMDMLTDLTAVDYPDREPRFEVVSHLYSLELGHRIRLKSQVGDADAGGAEIDSVTSLWGTANWLERECWDMFGVKFLGHPDLRRILLYPEFEGHPLRKDFPANRIQPLVPFREVSGIEKIPPFGPEEGMPFGRQSYERWGEGDLDEG